MLAAYWRIVIRHNFGKIIFLGFLSFLTGLVEVASLGLVIPVVTIFSGGDSPSGQRSVSVLEAAVRAFGLAPSPSRLLLLALAGVAVLIVLKSGLVLILNYVTAVVSQDTKRKLTLGMFAAYANARYSDLVRRARGGITKDIEKPPDATGYVIYYMGFSMAAAGQLLVTLGFLVWLSPGLTLAMVAVGLITLAVFRYALQMPMARLGRTDYSLEQAGSGLLVNVIDGNRIVKVHNLVDHLRARLEHILAARARIAVRQIAFQQVPKIIFELGGVLIVVTLVALAQMVPSLRLDFPALAAFVLALRQITPAASTLNTNFINMAQYWGQIQVVEDTLARLPQEDKSSGTASVPDIIHTVRLKSLTFAYPDSPNRPVLRNVSLTFTRGKVMALVGATGSGKTTIADLIIRLQEPEEGRIFANDVDIRRFSLTGWRDRIGYVGQDVFLFNTTLGQNVAGLDDRVPQAEIVRAAKLAQIHEFIVSLPDGYETSIGDRGVALSGGQRQRIAVARAILKRPKILILDEATSALDALTERALHEAIDFMRHDSIVILIAHRLSTVEDAEDIVVLDEGEVSEQGSHDSLMGRRGLYWRLYSANTEPPSVVFEPDDHPKDRV